MSDMTLQEAINETQKFGRFIKAFEKIAETGTAFAGVDQAISEKTAIAASIAGEIETLAKKREALQRDIADANDHAPAIIAAANVQAEEITREAQRLADEATASAQSAVALAKAELEQVTDEAAAKRSEVESAQQELDEINARIAAALEQARKVFGGEG